MRKLTILALHMGYGGIEKSIASLARAFSYEYEVTILSAYELHNKPVYDIERNVKVVYLKRGLKPNKKELKASLKKHKYFKFLIELFKGKKIIDEKEKLMIDYIKNTDSDIIISTRPQFNFLLNDYGKTSCIKIAWEHNNFDDKEYFKKLEKHSNNIDYFVNISKEQNEFYKKMFNDKCVLINEFIDKMPVRVSTLEAKRILFVGMMSKDKGLEDLIDVFKIVSQKYNDWSLDIVGGGHEFDKISKIISKEKLNINLHGFRDKEYLERLYLNSSIYVMTSYKESFGLTLLEAQSYGLPSVAFDRALGAKNLISDNWDGYLVKYSDKEKMARRIIELIENKNRRIIMGNNACKKASKYDKNSIKKDWINLFNK